MGPEDADLQPQVIGVDQRDGVWWFVTGAGDEFVSLGVNHVEPYLMTAPYNVRRTLEHYGADFITPDGRFNPYGAAAATWLEQVKRDFLAWRFTAFGFHTDVPLELVNDDFHYIARIRVAPLEMYARSVARPDVFSPAFARELENEVRRVCLLHKGERNLLGYAFVDIPEWTLAPLRYQSPPIVHPWVDALRALDADAPGKQAWIAVLREHYRAPQAAADAHGLRADSWEELQAHIVWPTPKDDRAVGKDSEAMLGAIAERWYALHSYYIRRHDPYHLILGDKLRGAALPQFLLPILQRHVDVILIQWYGRFAQQEAALRQIHAATGKPILLGDSSFSVVQPHQDLAKGVHVRSQREVGEEYMAYLRDIMSLPFVIGWHHCGYIEGWRGLVVENEPYVDRQCGFKDPLERVHEDAVARVRQANAHAQAWHQQSRGQRRAGEGSS